ncbi:disulfide bond formation protein B [Marinospirillum sp. MEB164]|uniref:Disulfide bond formation protein B n=1 Tax=Marinospirillum alkalitolerans TaxID=3123374 RepID=A0ABW8PXX0_9GAMM
MPPLLTWIGRHALFLTFLGSSLILASAFAYEAITGLQPCHLCWIQRWLFAGLALISFLAWCLPAQWLRRLLALPFVLLALSGIGVALRHLYIKLNPHTVSCGMDVETLLDFLPLREAIQEMLLGSADCAQVANFLGLPLPSWTLSGYLLLGGLGLYGLLARRSRRSASQLL